MVIIFIGSIFRLGFTIFQKSDLEFFRDRSCSQQENYRRVLASNQDISSIYLSTLYRFARTLRDIPMKKILIEDYVGSQIELH